MRLDRREIVFLRRLPISNLSYQFLTICQTSSAQGLSTQTVECCQDKQKVISLDVRNWHFVMILWQFCRGFSLSFTRLLQILVNVDPVWLTFQFRIRIQILRPFPGRSLIKSLDSVNARSMSTKLCLKENGFTAASPSYVVKTFGFFSWKKYEYASSNFFASKQLI